MIFSVLTAVATSAQAIPETKPAGPPMRAELKYQDPVVAVHDGYLSTLACLNFPHKSLAGHEQYPMGAMGVHFINAQLVGPVLDPMKPQILLYEPDGAGKLRLTGAEWFVPLAIAKGEQFCTVRREQRSEHWVSLLIKGDRLRCPPPRVPAVLEVL